MAADTLPNSSKIAIVGIGCRFANGINNTEDFKRMLYEGLDCTIPPPDGRYDMTHFYSLNKSPGKMYTRGGGYLTEDLENFDREFFKISPEEANLLDPQVRLSLEVAYESLENAGIPTNKLKGTRTGVYMGVTSSEYGLLGALPHDNISQYTNSGSNSCMVANRLSYEFDLRGPSFSVDTACSSSLYAVYLACEAIRQGQCDQALAGGVNLLLMPYTTIGFCQAGMLAPDGRCKSFDKSADGYSRSEGAGVVVLKPLAKALEDGDNIYTVIRGGALSNDGRTPGIVNPSYDAQTDLVFRACKQAQVDPHKIEYIEAHGTGTKVGDKTEANALGEALSQTRSKHEPKLYIGSVKSNVGHTEGAAGVAAVIKVAIMHRYDIIPPVVHFKEPNENIPLEKLNMTVPTQVVPWPRPKEGKRRLAGCSSFGFGGANAHIVMEEPPNTKQPSRYHFDKQTILFLSAGTKDALIPRKIMMEQKLLKDVTASSQFQDIAATSFHRSTHHRNRCAIVANSAELAARKLTKPDEDVIEGTAATNADTLSGKVFVFTGMGSQWWAMGRSLYKEDSTFRNTINMFDQELAALGAKWTMRHLLTETANKDTINETQYAQPAICAVEMGLVNVLKDYGIEPDAIIGHSVGEVPAAYASKRLSFGDAVRVIYYRGQELSKTSGKGAMLAVLHAANDVRAKLNKSGLKNNIDVAVINSPTQIVLSGDTTAIQKFKSQLEGEGIRSVLLKVNNAFHSFQQEPLQSSLKEKLSFLTKTPDEKPDHIAMVSTVTGTYVSTKQLNDRDYWWRNVRRSVNFLAGFELLLREGYTTFIEIGAHPALNPAMKDIISAQEQPPKAFVLETLKRPRDVSKPADDQTLLLRCLAKLHCEGYQVDFTCLYPERYSVQQLPLYPWQKVHCTAISEESRRFLLHPRKPHNLLGEKQDRTPSTPDGTHNWRSELTVMTVPWVRDHVIQSSIIAPGTSYLEISIEATKQLQDKKHSSCTIKDINLKKFLFMPDCKASLSVIVQKKDDEMELSILSKGGKDTWSTHAMATICPNFHNRDVSKLSIHDMKQKCTGRDAKDQDFLYTKFHKLGYSLGPSFQVLKQAWFSEDIRTVYMKISATDEIRHELGIYNIHPALFDSLFQGLGITTTLIKERHAMISKAKYIPKVYVPLAIKEMHIIRSVPDELFAKIEVLDEEPMLANITLVDQDGYVCVALTGVVFGMAAEGDEGQEIQLWKMDFEERVFEETIQQDTSGKIVAFYGTPEDERVLVDQMSTMRNLHTESIQTLQKNHFRVLKRHKDVEHIVFLASDIDLGSKSSVCSPVDFQTAIANNLVVLTQLVKELKKSDVNKPTLWLLTRGALSVGDSDPCSPFATSVLSFGLSMMQEAIDIKVYMIDLPQSQTDFQKCLPEVQRLIANPPEDDNELLLTASSRGKPRIFARRLGYYAPSAIKHTVGKGRWAVRDDAKSNSLTLVPCTNTEPTKNNEARVQVKACKFLRNSNNGGFTAIVAGPFTGRLNGYKAGDYLVGFTSSRIQANMNLDGMFCAKIPGEMDCETAVMGVDKFLTAYVMASSVDVRKKTCLVVGEDQEEVTTFQDVIKLLGGSVGDTLSECMVDTIVSLSKRGTGIPKAHLQHLKSFGQIVSVVDREVENGVLDISKISNKKGFSTVTTISRHLHPEHCVASGLHDILSTLLRKVVSHFSSQTGKAKTLANGVEKTTGDAFTVDNNSKDVQLQLKGNSFQANPGASYVVVGASKGFGVELLQWLTNCGAKQIIAVSRSSPQGEDAEKVRQIENCGTRLTWHKADVSDYNSIRRILQSSKVPIEGIFHAAAVYQDMWLDSLEESDWIKVLMPKAYGAYLMHRVSNELNLPLKHFVVFSSITGLVGSAGQANYCAANSFLMGLGSMRKSQGLPATVASIGVINTIGFAARNDLIETWENKGFGSLAPNKALDIIGMMMNLDIPHMGMTGFFIPKDYYIHLRPQVNEHLRNLEGSFSRWKHLFKKDLLQDNNTGMSKTLKDETPAAAKDVIRNELVSFLAQKLGVADPESITIDSPPVAYGLDSLMSPDMSSHLSETFHVAVLPVELLNDRNTIGKLIDSIYEKIMATAGPGATQQQETVARPKLVTSSSLTNPSSILVCFPPNGGGASTFHEWMGWAEHNNVMLYIMQFPGSEGNPGKPMNNLTDIVFASAAEVAKVVQDKKFTIYGHSFGGLIAYEVAHSLNDIHGILPTDLFLGAWYSPLDPYIDTNDTPPGIFDPATPLDKAIEMARQFKFLGNDILQNKNAMKLMLPCIEASLSMCHAYRHNHSKKLPCNLTVYGATLDHFTPVQAVCRWSSVAHPAHTFNFKKLKGNHMFVLDGDCVRIILADITVCLVQESMGHEITQV